MSNFKTCTIGTGTSSSYFDVLVYRNGVLVYLSCANTNARVERIYNDMSRQSSFYSVNDRMYLNMGGKGYNSLKKKDSKNGYSHLIAYKKDEVRELNNDEEGNSNELRSLCIYLPRSDFRIKTL